MIPLHITVPGIGDVTIPWDEAQGQYKLDARPFLHLYVFREAGRWQAEMHFEDGDDVSMGLWPNNVDDPLELARRSLLSLVPFMTDEIRVALTAGAQP